MSALTKDTTLAFLSSVFSLLVYCKIHCHLSVDCSQISFLPRSFSWALAHISTLLGIITWNLRLMKNLCVLFFMCCKSGFPGSKLLRWDLHPQKAGWGMLSGSVPWGWWKKQDRAQGGVELHNTCNKGFSQSYKELFRVVPVGPKGRDLSILLYPLHQTVNG